jgi:hypothetical protein
MFLDRMTLDEFAMYNRATGVKVTKVDGIWWAEVRPFFFRPLFPFIEIYPGSKRYPAKSRLGGFLHPVPLGVSANANLNMFIYDEIQKYSLNILKEKQRYITRKGLKNFTVRPITDVTELATSGYKVYMSFYNRTKYVYKNERTLKKHFVHWAYTLFEFPKLLILGAYNQNILSAIDISYRVEDVIIDDTFFSDSLSQNLKVTDALLHTLREIASTSGASFLCRGLPSGKQSLDASKIMRGCRILTMPATYKINALALYATKYFMKDSYNKYLALTTNPSSSEP